MWWLNLQCSQPHDVMKVIHIYETVLPILDFNLFPQWGRAIWDSLVKSGGSSRSDYNEAQDPEGKQQDSTECSLAEMEFSTLAGLKAFLTYKCY